MVSIICRSENKDRQKLDNLFCALCQEGFIGLDLLKKFTVRTIYLLAFLGRKTEKFTRMKSKLVNQFKLDMKKASNLMTATKSKGDQCKEQDKVNNVDTVAKSVEDMDVEQDKVNNENTVAKSVEDKDIEQDKVNNEDTVAKLVEDMNVEQDKVNNEDTVAKSVEDKNVEQDKVNNEDTVVKSVEDKDIEQDKVNNEDTVAKSVEDMNVEQDKVNNKSTVAKQMEEKDVNNKSSAEQWIEDKDMEQDVVVMLNHECIERNRLKSNGIIGYHDIDSEYSEYDNSDDDPDFVPGSENSEDEMSDCVPYPFLSHISNVETIDDEEYVPDGPSIEEQENSDERQNSTRNSRCNNEQPLAIQVSPAESNLKPEERLEDINYPGIFIKRYAKGANDQSKHKRTYDRRHAWFFCGKLKTNIQTHLEHAHI